MTALWQTLAVMGPYAVLFTFLVVLVSAMISWADRS